MSRILGRKKRRTWVGKLMYLRASYWHHEDMMFEKEQKEYLRWRRRRRRRR